MMYQESDNLTATTMHEWHKCPTIKRDGKLYNHEGLDNERVKIIFMPIWRVEGNWYIVLGYGPWIPANYCPYCGEELK